MITLDAAILALDGAVHHLEMNHERRYGLGAAPHGHASRWNWQRTRDSIHFATQGWRVAPARKKGRK